MVTAFTRVCAFEVACMSVCVFVSKGGHGDAHASLCVKGTAGCEAIFKLLKAIKRKFLNTSPIASFLPSCQFPLLCVCLPIPCRRDISQEVI